jgi:outer membrane lipoprotein-sorting protein
MRRIALVLTIAAAVPLLSGAGQMAPGRLYRAYTDAEKADLDKVSAALNAIHTLRSGFLQIGPEGGADQGELFIEKPGHIRFEYRPPNPLLIVATGGALYVKNAKLNTLDKYDLSDTPLGLLLNENVDLAHNKAVMGVEESNGNIVVRARSSNTRNNSNISLVFALPGVELRQWTIRDNQGGVTTVALQNPTPGVAMDETLFEAPQKTPRQKVGAN